MRIGTRFYISWLLSAVTMFMLFYLWHGIFLNDFKRIQFPITWFITFAAFSYLLIGAGIYFLFESRLLKNIENLFARSLVCGALSGFCLFMVATIIHISLMKQISKEHMLLEIAWQIAEQTAGSLVILVLAHFIRDPISSEI